MRDALDRRAFLIALVAASSSVAAVADDDDDDGRRRDRRGGRHDHDRARRALEEGRARPLADILTKVRPRLGGDVIGVELESENGRYVYELKVITPAGQLREIEVDALTAEILKDEED